MAGAMLEHISLVCFGASYAVALALEIVRLFRPLPILRVLSLIAVAAGLVAHTLYIVYHFFVFDLYGSIHHPKVAWGLFVLPVILGLVGLAHVFDTKVLVTPSWNGELIWSVVHGVILLLAAVGVCVGFVASIMYLVQAWRLRGKTPPGQGLQLLSLERLEEMSRRAVMWAFPLLTAGVLIGVMQLAAHREDLHGWSDPKIWGAAGLWVVFGLLLYLRLSRQLQGRRAALMTIVAFVVLIFTLVASHTVVQGGNP
jgi:ABC-type transport system involved in cytochrome c biogenesis permease subunit